MVSTVPNQITAVETVNNMTASTDPATSQVRIAPFFPLRTVDLLLYKTTRPSMCPSSLQLHALAMHANTITSTTFTSTWSIIQPLPTATLARRGVILALDKLRE